MNHRFRKLSHKMKEEGFVSAVGFVIRDVYFRVLAMAAFPSGRTKPPVAGGRSPFDEFVTGMSQLASPKVLEIGSRAVSDNTMRHKFPATVRHTGLDLHPGPNVDRVGDAHELGTLFEHGQFDGVFCFSVFEHLLMPWVVALEINKVLKTGGLVMIATHPTWPPHELPWDFWRYQENAFWALFNKSTGFEIVCTITSTPARIFPLEKSSYLLGTTKTIAPMGVAVLARKISSSDPRLAWPLKAADITETYYPTAGAKGAGT